MKATEAAKTPIGHVSDAPPKETSPYDRFTMNIITLGRYAMMAPIEDASNPEYPLQLRRQMLTTADYQRGVTGVCIERWCRVDEEGREHPMANLMLQNEAQNRAYPLPTVDGQGGEVDADAIQALPLEQRRTRSFLAVKIMNDNSLEV